MYLWLVSSNNGSPFGNTLQRINDPKRANAMRDSQPKDVKRQSIQQVHIFGQVVVHMRQSSNIIIEYVIPIPCIITVAQGINDVIGTIRRVLLHYTIFDIRRKKRDIILQTHQGMFSGQVGDSNCSILHVSTNK